MRIGINALFLLPGEVGGSEVYLRNLLQQFESLGRGSACTIFVNREANGYFDDIVPSATLAHCPVNARNRMLRVLWEQLVLPVQVRKRRLDVLLSAGMSAPFVLPLASVLTIHDLQHVNQPQHFSKFYRMCLGAIVYWSARTADRIIAVSNTVKHDLVRRYRIADSKVFVIQHGLAADVHQGVKGDKDGPARRNALPERYVVYPASLHPHKNHHRLL